MSKLNISKSRFLELLSEEISEVVYPYETCIEEQSKKYNAEKSDKLCNMVKMRYNESITNHMNKILSEADPSSNVVDKPEEGSTIDIYQKAISALNLWIGSRYAPSQKRWFGDTEKSFEYWVKELYGNSELAPKILQRAARIPVYEIPAYYGQREVEQGKMGKDEPHHHTVGYERDHGV
jgi:hypothetical protein